MNDPAEALAGSQRAAILLLSLGEEGASQVLKHVSPQELKRLGQAMTALHNVSKDQVDSVLRSFAAAAEKHSAFGGIGNEQYLQNVLQRAVGPDEAEGLIDQILRSRSTNGLETLNWMDPRGVTHIIKSEHPQVIAAVLAHLSSEQALNVLRLLPEERHADILIRVATLEGVPDTAISDLDEIMQSRIEDTVSQSSDIGGMKLAAAILNGSGQEMESSVIKQIMEVDAELGRQIEELMFVFDSLLDVDDRGLQILLREVQSDRLVLALKGAEPAVVEKLLGNMSARAREILEEDMEALGPVRLADVEEAQKEILDTTKALAEEGKLRIGDDDEKYV